MFKETIDKWNNSLKERTDLLDLVCGIHSSLMDVNNLSALLSDSVVDHIEILYNGIVLVMKEKYNKLKMFINEDDFGDVSMTVLCTGDYETEETDMVYKLLEFYKDDKDFTMFDVGANVGWYSLNALNICPEMKLHSFEPSPITYQRLLNNLKINNRDRDIAHNIGFFDKTDKLDFYYDRSSSGASSLVNIREKEDIDKISVDVVRMDEWAAKNGIDKVDFIKCDVEGAELFVYKGGMELISKSKPIIFSEMLRKWSAKFGYHPNDIINLFEAVGYKCYTIKEKGKLKKFGRVDDDTVETNYFFLHPERHEKIIAALCD